MLESKRWKTWRSVGGVACLCAVNAGAGTEAAAPSAKTLHVPKEHATIQAAIDAAADGDTVLVAPGTYHEPIRIAGKSVVLASEYLTTGDEKRVRETILDGTVQGIDGKETVRDQVILVEDNAGPNTEIVGFTIRDGDDGIRNHARIHIAHNYFTANVDAIDNEGGGGLIEHNLFEENEDDGVDFDLDSAGTVAHNRMINNGDDGIEIRLHDYRGEPLEVVFRDNVMIGNREDGIQIIDYPGMSDRHIRIERNLIANNAMAGIGLMSDATTAEDYRGADIPEPIDVVNNTIVGNEYGLTGGDNLVAINNIIAGNKQLGIKKVDGQSVASYNALWKNGTDYDEVSNVRDEHTIIADPKLDKDHRPAAGSACIDAGTTQLKAANRVVAGATAYEGAAPDLGAVESSGGKN